MSTPDWFILIQQWRVKGMGEYGVTLPFLVGALGYKSGESTLDAQQVRNVLNNIIEHPVDGYVTEVRWCGGIDAPVFTVALIDNSSGRMPFKSYLTSPSSEEAALGFSVDLQSEFGDLGCKNAKECYEKLIDYAAKHTEQGQFSRIRSEVEGKYVYGSFQPRDIKFIQETIVGS